MWESLQEYITLLLNSEEAIRVGGLTAVTLIVFAETGLFFCFFLPGDYLLFLAGVFAGRGDIKVSLFTLVASILVAAIAGNFTGYSIGRVLGERMMTWKDSLFFKKRYIDTTRKAYDKYGGRALVVGRFLPIVRTFAPVLAGIVKMPLSTFTKYNIVGGTLWVCLLTVSGYYLGEAYGEYVLKLVPFIIGFFLSVTTVTLIAGWLRMRKEAREEAQKAA